VRPPVVPGDPLGSQGDYSRYRPFLSAHHGRRVQQVAGRARSDRTRPIKLIAVRGDEA
jgi:hypothetical protein